MPGVLDLVREEALGARTALWELHPAAVDAALHGVVQLLGRSERGSPGVSL